MVWTGRFGFGDGDAAGPIARTSARDCHDEAGVGGSVGLNLTEVLSFTVLAHEGHDGRAADLLHVSTSCLSKRIQRLECQLGTTLVERGAGGVLTGTDPGRLFAVRAER